MEGLLFALRLAVALALLAFLAALLWASLRAIDK